ncbi:MAG: TIGR01212 family radical SAM protein [Spirochaetota bacterium]
MDAGFSCPNRGTDRSGGCSYCDDLGATAVYNRPDEQSLAQEGIFRPEQVTTASGNPAGITMKSRLASIKEQIESGSAFLQRRYQAELLMLYFQSYSNTYGTVNELKQIYDAALSYGDFTEMIVATRPDCIDMKKAELLSLYRNRLSDVWVELGLQSGNDNTLATLERGHTVKQFVKAFALLRQAGIRISVHLILGLPGEGYRELEKTAALITQLHPEGIKIHNLHIPAGTKLYRQYLDGELSVASTRRHMSQTIWFLERIPGDIVIQRLVCETPQHRLAAPRGFVGKGHFIQMLQRELEKRNTYQGRMLHKGGDHE